MGTKDDGEIIFEHRAKLYRWGCAVQSTKPEFRNRGLGQLKIIKKPNGNYFMKLSEDKTLKLRMKQNVSQEVKLEPMVSAKNAWTWSCKDFADDPDNGEPHVFALRFKTPEVASEFKEQYEKCQQDEACR